MGVVGFQDVWRTGSRVFVIPDPPELGKFLDLGTIQVVSPSNEIEEAKLEDSESGVKKLIAKELSKFVEKYEVTLHNLNMPNLQYLFFGNEVQSFGQSVGTFSGTPSGVTAVNHVVPKRGELVKLRSAYRKSLAEYLYMVSEFGALGIAPSLAITAVTATTFVVTQPTGVAASARWAAGDRFVVFSNATAAANTEYIVISTSGTGATTTLTVADTKGATASGRLANVESSLSNVHDHAITGGTTSTITLAGDWTDHYSAGSKVFVHSNATALCNNGQAKLAPTIATSNQIAQANYWTVASVAFSVATTTITLVETMGGSPTASGKVSKVAVLNTDYEVSDFERGVIRILKDATLLVDGQAIRPIFTLNSIPTGDRLIRPQTKQGSFEANVIVEWNRGNFAQRTVREFRASLVPGAGSFSDTDFSTFPLTIEVLADLTDSTNPAGRLLSYKGPLPSKS